METTSKPSSLPQSRMIEIINHTNGSDHVKNGDDSIGCTSANIKPKTVKIQVKQPNFISKRNSSLRHFIQNKLYQSHKILEIAQKFGGNIWCI